MKSIKIETVKDSKLAEMLIEDNAKNGYDLISMSHSSDGIMCSFKHRLADLISNGDVISVYKESPDKYWVDSRGRINEICLLDDDELMDTLAFLEKDESSLSNNKQKSMKAMREEANNRFSSMDKYKSVFDAVRKVMQKDGK